MNLLEFHAFPKIPRYSRDCVVTEKIDGTNAQILIVPSPEAAGPLAIARAALGTEMFDLYAGSRTRWLTLEKDNYGFARWVADNAIELLKLGPGRHFGEWWGLGIQRNYGLREKRFSLFNIKKWKLERPSCCHVVPVIANGEFGCVNSHGHTIVDIAMNLLSNCGSYASPGYMNPEGVVIYHTAGNLLFKKTFDNDAAGKEG